MSEIQHSPTSNAAEQSQRFIEFIMMQAQQAALCLGQIAHPTTGKAEVNLNAAKMFIDHLEIVHQKTRGNLNTDEEKILVSILSELQLAFVHVAGGNTGATHIHDENCNHDSVPDELAPAENLASSDSSTTTSPAPSEEEDKKKFTKSYGA